MTAINKQDPFLHLHPISASMSKDLDRLPHRAISLYSLQARAYRYRPQLTKEIQRLRVAKPTWAEAPAALPAVPRLARPKKTVSFAPTVSVAPIAKTPADLTNAWYDKSEYKQFEANRRLTISEINKVHGNLSQLDPTEHCVLGLEEQLTRRQILVRKLKASHYTQLVLEKLNSPRDGQHTGEIQALASMLSRHSSHRAQWRAMLGRTDVA